MEEQKKKSKKAVVLIVIFVLLIIGVIVYFAFFNKKDETQNEQPQTETKSTTPKVSVKLKSPKQNNFVIPEDKPSATDVSLTKSGDIFSGGVKVGSTLTAKVPVNIYLDDNYTPDETLFGYNRQFNAGERIGIVKKINSHTYTVANYSTDKPTNNTFNVERKDTNFKIS